MYHQNDLIFQTPDQSVLELARGQFARQILVLVAAEAEANANRDFLNKILGAAGLDLQQDTLLAEIPETQPLKLPLNPKNKRPEFILVFGLRPDQLGLRIEAPLYKAIPFYGLTFLFSEKLSVLEPDKARKTQLWQALRQLFL